MGLLLSLNVRIEGLQIDSNIRRPSSRIYSPRITTTVLLIDPIQLQNFQGISGLSVPLLSREISRGVTT